MPYFRICNSDGDTYVDIIDPQKLSTDIANGEYGDNPAFLASIPESNTDYWGNVTLLIKGEIVVPRPKEVVTKYELD